MPQGGPLAIIAYGIGILPLIKNMKRAISDVTQPWYADYAGALDTFARLENYFDSLIRQGPGQGYHPDPTKSVLSVLPENIEAGKMFGHVTDLGCARAHNILGVALGKTSPNAIG